MKYYCSMKLKNILSIVPVLAMSVIVVSCIEEYDLSIQGEVADYVCIDAILSTNDSVQTVYVRHLHDFDVSTRWVSTSINIVNVTDPSIPNAKIRLTDNDTKEIYIYEEVRTYDRNKPDLYFYHYELNNFKPIVNHTYTIDIEVCGKNFTSTQTVHRAPIIDTIMARPYWDSEYLDKAKRPIVHLTDTEPDSVNYCIFIEDRSVSHIRGLHRYDCAIHNLPYSLFSDEGSKLQRYIINLPHGMGNYEYDKYTSGITSTEVWSLSEENYVFFREMQKQMETDGGIYTPYSRTPPTNFEGENVLGQFIATDVYRYEFSWSF